MMQVTNEIRSVYEKIKKPVENFIEEPEMFDEDDDIEKFWKSLKKNNEVPGKQEEPWIPVEGRRFKKTRNFRRNVQAMKKHQEQPEEDKKTWCKAKTLLEEMQVSVRTSRWNRAKPKINLLIKHEPEGFNTVRGDDEWELITMYVDSGATETVIAETMLNMMEIAKSPQSERGVEYEVANGKKIPNLGQKQFVAHTEEGMKRQVLAQVCEVNKALLSVSKAVGQGNKVVFGEIDEFGNVINYIEDNITKERLWMVEENGMYALKIWVRKDGKEAGAPF